MNIAYRSKKLEKTLTDAVLMKKEYGTMAKRVSQRMEQLKSSENLAVLVSLPIHCHALSGDRKGEWAIDISGNHRLIFEINQNPIPLKDDHSVNTVLITAIRILETTDYH